MAEFTAGSDQGTPFYVGQSFTTAAGGPFNRLSFNFFSGTGAGMMPSALGSLFFLSQQYLGTPSSLSAATAGFLGASTSAVGGIYQFDPTLTLMGSTQYFAYTNALVPISGAFSDAYPGGVAYVADSGTSNYTQFPADANFRLSGTQAASAVPLPGTLALFGLGLAALVVTQRRRKPSI